MKKIKEIILILVVILISVIAFLGIQKKENGVWKNLVADYDYGMDLEGARELKYALNVSEEEKYVYVDENGNIKGEVLKDGTPVTAEEDATVAEGQVEEISYTRESRKIKANSDEKLTKENFEKTKEIIQNRLKNQNIGEYNIRLDDITGKLAIETGNDNEQVKIVQSLVSQIGKFQIIDHQNGLVLMDNSDIKNVSTSYMGQNGYQASLIIEFNKQGSDKLREISKKYVQTVEIKDGQEGEEETQETTTKYVSVVLDDMTMMTTYFGAEMTNGILQIVMGEEKATYAEISEYMQSAILVANVLDSGKLPISYELETDNFVKSQVDMRDIKIGVIAIIAVISIALIVKFRANGVKSAILGVGYIAILSLVLRYTNVVLTINSVIACGIVIFMNYAFMRMFLIKCKSNGQAYGESMKKFYLTIIPVIVIAVVFTMASFTTINSIGMVLFWGILLNLAYNYIFTRIIFKK